MKVELISRLHAVERCIPSPARVLDKIRKLLRAEETGYYAHCLTILLLGHIENYLAIEVSEAYFRY